MWMSAACGRCADPDAAYHFLPHERFSPYIGAGINATFFYGAQAAGTPVTQVAFSNNVGAAIQAGFITISPGTGSPIST